MGRPRAVVLKNFKDYDKLHTEPTKMMAGVYLNTLYPIKETAHFYTSCEVWAYCANKFKKKKKYLPNLEVKIKELQDSKAVNFLKKYDSEEYIYEEFKEEAKEAIDFLKKIYPDHNYHRCRRLEQILSAYNHGTLVRYNEIGEEREPNDIDIKRRKALTHDFFKFYGATGKAGDKIKTAYENWSKADRSKLTEEERDRLFSEYYLEEREYVFKKHDLTPIFRTIGEHAVCLPMAFTHGTADWHKEKYGKTCAYAHAGEVFFVVTKDSVYFTITRHF